MSKPTSRMKRRRFVTLVAMSGAALPATALPPLVIRRGGDFLG